MSRPVHVDMAEIETALARAKAAMAPIGRQDDSHGAQARMSIAVHHAFTRQFAAEINRHTSAEDISDALAAICCGMICDLVDTMLPEQACPEDRFAIVERQMSKTAHFLSQRFNGQTETVNSEVVYTQRGGRA
jgi:hypothetical protein